MATKYEYRTSTPGFPAGKLVIDNQGRYIPAGVVGNTYFVDYRNGNDNNSGESIEKAFKTLSAAYSAVTSNNNDVIYVDGDSTVQEDTMITWAKNRVHVIGVGGGFITGQRAKLQLSTTGNAAAVAATLTVTGVGNTFTGLKIMNSGTDAASVAAVIDAGEANVWNNCSAMKFTDLNVAAVADFICRADSCVYVDCEFGFDTLVQTAARPTLWFKNDGSTRAKHCKFIRPVFTCASSEATKSFVKIENTSSLAFSNEMIDPVFNNALVSSLSAAALNDAVTSASGLVEGNLFIVNPASNTTEFCSAVTDQIQVVGPAVSQQAGEAVTPS